MLFRSITNVDIDTEYRYLIALNTDLQNIDKKKVMNIAKDSIIREKIKEDEYLKYYDLNIKNKYIDRILNNFYKKLGMKNNDSDVKQAFCIVCHPFDLCSLEET